MKKKTGRKIVGILILLIGLGLIGTAAYKIFAIQNDYKRSNKEYAVLNADYLKENPDADKWYELATIDLDQVREINRDVIGWIYFENEDISYPILYSGDDTTYLRKTLTGTSATAGSIFLEGKNNPNLQDAHSIIYGHNMKNLSMFGKLKFYNRDEEYYDKHRYFQIFTDDAVYRYEIFAYGTVDEYDEIYSVWHESGDGFAEFIDKIYKKSMRVTNVEATKEDKLVTLSTCSTSSDDYRFVVNAVITDSHSFKGEEE